jgi:hypothetical protein
MCLLGVTAIIERSPGFHPLDGRGNSGRVTAIVLTQLPKATLPAMYWGTPKIPVRIGALQQAGSAESVCS